MNNSLFYFTSIPFLAFISATVVGALTPIVRKIAVTLEVWDLPSEAHKTHKEPVPYLGGLAIMTGVVIVTLFAVLIGGLGFDVIAMLLALLIPALFLGVVGLLDDIFNLSPWSRFLAQTFSGLITSTALVYGNTKGDLFDSELFNSFVTILWIVGICNAVNFLDNIDGGASGSVAISALFISILAFTSKQYYVAALSAVVCGSCLGFLYWNRNPAKIYMGDAGSLFLGVIIATLAIRLDPPVSNREVALLIPVLLLSLPILDTTTVVFSRLHRRVSPFRGGRDHLSHRLMFNGISKRQTILTLWAFSFSFGVLSMMIVALETTKTQGAAAIISMMFWFFLFVKFIKMKFEEAC